MVVENSTHLGKSRSSIGIRVKFMQVLHLISSSGFYGADNVLIELSKKLRQTAFSPVIGVFKNIHNPHLEVAEEAKRYNLPLQIFSCNGRLDPRTILLIRRFVEEQKINLIHTHGYKSNFYTLAAALGKKVPMITTCHNWLGDDIKMRLYARLDKFFLNQFDRIIAVSDAVKQEILNHSISPEKVVTIYNGIDIERFNNRVKENNIRREFGIGEDCKVIGTVGRLSEEKGHVYLLKAAEKVLQKYPKVVFLIVGDGPLRKYLEENSSQIVDKLYSQKACPKNPFIFTGVRSDISTIYALMDIFVLPSLTEGLPMVLLEAMASQKPVIATDVGAVPKVFEHGRSGLLIEPGNVNSLAMAIMELLANPQKAQKMAKHARQKVEQEFSSDIMTEKYLDVYQDMLQS